MPIDMLMRTQLSQKNADGTLSFQLRAEDFAGTKDRGGVRLFDQDGHVLDVPLGWRKTIGNLRGPNDDLWVGNLRVDALPAGTKLHELRAKGWVDVDQPDGGKHRVWEDGPSVPVTEAARDRLVDIPREVHEPAQLDDWRTLSCAMQHGALELTQYTCGEMLGSHMVGYHHCLKGARFVDQDGAYAGAETLELLLIPRSRLVDRRDHYGEHGYAPKVYVERELRELQQMNRITLRRQSDGSFAASAPELKAFARFLSYDATVYMSDVYQLRGWELALHDPRADAWDSRGGQNYLVAL